MKEGRTILHSDLNSFYASVEMMLDPSLKNKAVAVCGSTDERHGIVLAKSELAKKAGVKTGMVNWEAQRLCPNIIMVPPQYDQYVKYSKLTREIYERFTDRVEPYGMDECWLDITGSTVLFGSGEQVANKIRKAVFEELGITVSIGVSFNKVFAKLGSDMKKPDAITCINKDNFKEKIWTLPASDLFYVGRSTKRKLLTYGINTIGDIAKADIKLFKRLLGKNGEMIWRYANGLDNSIVMPCGYQSQIKSIGHGITCTSDLENNDEVWKVIFELSQDIGHKLRVHELSACGVQLTIKDNTLMYNQFQAQINTSTQSPMELSQKAYELFLKNYQWSTNVRALTIRAINLVPKSQPEQISIYEDIEYREKRARLDDVVDKIRGRFGKKAVMPAVLLGDIKMPKHSSNEIIMPKIMI